MALKCTLHCIHPVFTHQLSHEEDMVEAELRRPVSVAADKCGVYKET